MRGVMWAVFAALLLGALPVHVGTVAAQGRDCASLPTTAQKARTCSPQAECLAQVERSLKGQALDASRRDCQRLPTSGTCYGPETYNPQAECRERQGRR
jgi:hypothetical protein